MNKGELVRGGLATGEVALDFVLSRYGFESVLDIGSGSQAHAAVFRAAGKRVVCVDASDHYGVMPDVRGDFNVLEFDEQFDLVWCCHVLEHQLNVHDFLRKVWSVMKPGGVLAITVPPMRNKLVGGHVTAWNASQLAYNMILAGFDLSDASIKVYGYNVTIVCRKRRAEYSGLVMDAGDIERLARFFPFPVWQGKDGRVEEANWSVEPDLRPIAGPVQDSQTLEIEAFSRTPCPFANDLEALEWAAKCVEAGGFFAEFGVYRGRSLAKLCEIASNATVFGFDSFAGLPEKWVRSPDSTYKAGHFGLRSIPAAPANARLVPGFFSDTLPGWLKEHEGPAAFLHIDSDLYSSAKDVLWALNERIQLGSVIVFDELCDWNEGGVYPFWRDGEWKALIEWMGTFDRKIRVLGRGPQYSGAVVVVK